jgi:hypothetical protein
MRHKKKVIGLIVFILVAGIIGVVFSYKAFFGNSASWKEDALQNDGSIVVVKRWQDRRGRHEIGQEPPIGDQSIKFALPKSGKTITWRDEYSQDVGGANFTILALHILKNIPYLITNPAGCLAYNKWGRPNPPYVIFRYENNGWKQIKLMKLPDEFKELNLVIDSDNYEKELVKLGEVSPEKIKKLKSSLKQPEFKTILRKPLLNEESGCPVMIEYKCKGVHAGWGAPGEFNRKYFERICK